LIFFKDKLFVYFKYVGHFLPLPETDDFRLLGSFVSEGEEKVKRAAGVSRGMDVRCAFGRYSIKYRRISES